MKNYEQSLKDHCNIINRNSTHCPLNKGKREFQRPFLQNNGHNLQKCEENYKMI